MSKITTIDDLEKMIKSNEKILISNRSNFPYEEHMDNTSFLLCEPICANEAAS